MHPLQLLAVRLADTITRTHIHAWCLSPECVQDNGFIASVGVLSCTQWYYHYFGYCTLGQKSPCGPVVCIVPVGVDIPHFIVIGITYKNILNLLKSK